MKKVRFGIIGAAQIANKFCNAVKLVNDAEVIAISSKSLERAKLFAENNQIKYAYGDYEEMLSNKDIDAVYIATTQNYHFQNLMQSIEYNKHIMCEKCMVMTKNEAEIVFNEAAKKNLFVMEAMWSRFLPYINKAKEWICEGKIGNVEMINGMIGFIAYNNPEGRLLNPKLGGGALYDIGVYLIELVSYLIGKEILDVKSMIIRSDTGVDKISNLLLYFDSCIASLQCTLQAKVKEAVNLYGDKGYIHIPVIHHGTSCQCFDYNDNLIAEFDQKYENGFVYEIEEMVNCINKGLLESSIIPHKDTIKCAEIFEKCLK